MSSEIPQIRTRLLIISDTHGIGLFDPATHPKEARKYAFRRPLEKADVAIHCGDLTISSSIREYQTTFDIMREIDAPLKLVIPGNHDCSMDLKFWEWECARRSRFLPSEMLQSFRQRPRETYEVVEKARQDGIHILVAEGTYHFVLANGARLTVYASPWTPQYGDWGFQYDPAGDGGIVGGHDFQILEGTDVAMTHGPPYGILDRTTTGEDAGCRALLAAVRRARPRVHCFGHIHEGYGALLVPWDDDADMKRVEWDRDGDGDGDGDGVNGHGRAEIAVVSLCPRDTQGLGFTPGKDTLSVNAAIMNVHYRPHQAPWLVDLELPPPDSDHVAKAEQTTKMLSRPMTVEETVKPGMDGSVAS